MPLWAAEKLCLWVGVVEFVRSRGVGVRCSCDCGMGLLLLCTLESLEARR